mmetsp:Transcript_1594/g.1875  ORF Transcript_1594/g.1875 Transcript_1594/m.1875 type:complete len:283 (-) Transcript_1594:1135-1983(-)|eukprot:CAMPEP_0184008140 /NCGR_PEP_ID=MMETSP0954-20121128/1779_1 /TAXON_ID=627963 /ORGANISM="Aplanochytrium sp, Strain PBS07" /LENGTH=282 /DNA_ID=CAMNT_0026287159 /DNA_START=47 /DNA_END=895 /DNA_ORIENTATION=-
MQGILKTSTARKLAGVVQLPGSGLTGALSGLKLQSRGLAAAKKGGKRPRKAKKVERETFGPLFAIQQLKKRARANFDESLDISIHLGLDPRKPNQNIRTSIPLPHGTGKAARVCAFVPEDMIEEVKNAGADIIGDEDLIKQIEKEGKIEFDRCFATPEFQHSFKNVARKLGPRGLLPTAKLGTLTSDIVEAVKAAKCGPVNVRVNREGNILGSIGRISYSEEMLMDNLRAFFVGIADNKPEGAKGTYLLSCTISSTMGKAVPLHIKACDPSSNFFMLEKADA